MKRILSKLLWKIGAESHLFARRVYQSPRQRTLTAWYQQAGDQTLRLDYAMNAESLVFDLGGYEGQWASDIFARYCCKVYVFEPVIDFARNIQRRFAQNQNIVVFGFGLASQTYQATIALNSNSSSLYRSGSDQRSVTLLCAADFIEKYRLRKIDLIKINIEGGEYDLLEHLITSGLVSRMVNIQVQFHDFVPDAVKRREAIQTALAQTHELTYDYPFIWENWRLKPDMPRQISYKQPQLTEQ